MNYEQNLQSMYSKFFFIKTYMHIWTQNLNTVSTENILPLAKK